MLRRSVNSDKDCNTHQKKIVNCVMLSVSCVSFNVNYYSRNPFI